MRQIDASNAADALCAGGFVPADREIRVRELTGGVSNLVLRVEVAGEPPLVVKQCRERLRVAMEWTAPLERIWVEQEALEVLAELLPVGGVPRVLFEDRENYLFGMSCAADDAVTWKTRLMAGDVDPLIAMRAGEWLGLIHDRAREHPALDDGLADGSLFEQLRIEPYYRTSARAHPELSGAFEGLIQEMRGAGSDPGERTLVLGDYSPKNILVDRRDELTLLDFECACPATRRLTWGFF